MCNQMNSVDLYKDHQKQIPFNRFKIIIYMRGAERYSKGMCISLIL